MALNQTAASIPAMVLQRVAEHGDATILRKKDRGIWKAVPWSELGTRMQNAGMALRALGLRRGDVAGVLAETRPEWVTADLGILSAGGVSLGLPPDSTDEQVGDMLRDSACRVLFVESEEQLDKALAVRDRCPALQRIVIFDMIGLRDFADDGCESFAEFLDRGARQDDADRRAWQDGIAAITEQHPALLHMAPGGTRTLTHGDILRRIADARTHLQPRRGDERLVLLPMADMAEHVLGLYFALDSGIISNYLENPDTAIENLQQVQPTVLGADAAVWSELHKRITDAAAAATPLQRLLYRVAISAGQSGGAGGWLARALVLRQVRRELGLVRLRLAYTSAALTPVLQAWTSALGITVTPVDAARPATPTASKRYGALPVEA